MNAKIGIVVPTLGSRPEYLEQCLESIAYSKLGADNVHVTLVAPRKMDCSKYLNSGLANSHVYDPEEGLAAAINLGFSSMPEEIEYINWLGDDDLLEPGSLTATSSILDKFSNLVLVFGQCNYIDSTGATVWRNKSGPWAKSLLRFGPDLIPQPGALFRKSEFFKVGGLNTNYRWAFDFDLFIKLSKAGRFGYLNRVLASFRWHPESLSVEHREKSVYEASRVRVSHLPGALRVIATIWELPVRWATLLAGLRLTREIGKTQVRQ